MSGRGLPMPPFGHKWIVERSDLSGYNFVLRLRAEGSNSWSDSGRRFFNRRSQLRGKAMSILREHMRNVAHSRWLDKSLKEMNR